MWVYLIHGKQQTWSWQLFSDSVFWVSESSLLFNSHFFFFLFSVAIKIGIIIWWRVKDRRYSKILAWSDSIFYTFLGTWKCFIGKIYHTNILHTYISSHRSRNLVTSDGIIIKLKINVIPRLSHFLKFLIELLLFSTRVFSKLQNFIFSLK